MTNTHQTLPALSALVFFFLATASIPADDWPRWLGPQGDSVWRETGILEEFPVEGLKLRWKKEIAGGYSGPSVSEGKVFVTDWVPDPIGGQPKILNQGPIPKNQNFVRKLHPGTERILCLEEKSGKLLWKHEYKCDYTSVATYAIGPRCAPIVADEFVYCLGAEGDLLCLETASGKPVWSKNFVRDFGLKIPEWGVASHPLVDGKNLICIVGGKESTCVAFDRRTGEVRWKSGSASKPGYSTPVIFEWGGRRQLLVWHADAVDSLDPDNGRRIWTVPFQSTFAMSIGVPRKSGNRIFVMCFAGMCAAIDVAENGQSARLAWKGNRNKGMDGVMNTPFLQDGCIYGCGNGGRYVCADLDDGQQRWTTYQAASSQRPIQWGNVFTVKHADRFFLFNDKGELIIARMNPGGYQELGKTRIIEPTHQVGRRKLVWTHPAFANRSIYVRNDREIRCYSLAR